MRALVTVALLAALFTTVWALGYFGPHGMAVCTP